MMFGSVASPPPADSHVQRLIAHDKFVVDRWTGSAQHPVGGDQRCHIFVTLAGRVWLERDAAREPLRAGQTVLVPAAAGPLIVRPEASAVMLDMYVPA